MEEEVDDDETQSDREKDALVAMSISKVNGEATDKNIVPFLQEDPADRPFNHQERQGMEYYYIGDGEEEGEEEEKEEDEEEEEEEEEPDYFTIYGF